MTALCMHFVSSRFTFLPLTHGYFWESHQRRELRRSDEKLGLLKIQPLIFSFQFFILKSRRLSERLIVSVKLLFLFCYSICTFKDDRRLRIRFNERINSICVILMIGSRVTGKFLTDNVIRHCDKSREIETEQKPIVECKWVSFWIIAFFVNFIHSIKKLRQGRV